MAQALQNELSTRPNAAKKVFGNKVITADRFHVAKLYRKQLIVVRKSELIKLRKSLTKEEYKLLKPAVSLLQKGRDYFTDEEKIIDDPLFSYSKKLKLAYNYSHYLTSVFNSKITKEEATEKFRSWIADMPSSQLNYFNTFMGTVKKYMNEISNYFIQRNTSGFVEGFKMNCQHALGKV